jgi:fatty-acyl-CoA synthase
VADAACAGLPSLRVRVAFGEGGQSGNGVLAYEEMLANGGDGEPQVIVHEHDPYYYNLTSGTTGTPKCYAISHYNNATIFNMAMALDLSGQDVALTLIPMYGRIGFFWLAASVMYGMRNVLMNFAPDEALALIEQERVTVSNIVPTMGAMLLASPRLAQTDVSSLRGLVFAGSLLPAPVREGVTARLCPRLYEYYGMQESGALVVSTPEDRTQRADSVGRPILGCEVRVVDAEGRDLPRGETGAIVGRGPGTVTAYHHNPEKTAETFVDGWLHTGDLGRMDEEGFLFINGRLKDLIVTGGQNVHAGEVEEAILRVPGVADCAVIGLGDPLWGEAVTAVVVPAPGAQVDEAAVIAHCRQSLAGFKTPKRVIAQDDALPRTPTGKVQKFLLVARYQAPRA